MRVIPAGYDMIQVVCIISMSYMAVSIFSSFYAANHTISGIGADAGTAMMMKNPLMGLGDDDDDGDDSD